MSVYINPTYRIKRSAEQEDMMRLLISAKVFNQYKDIIMISAIIGYNNKEFMPITKSASDGILMQFFTQRDYDVMDLIAYGHEKSQALLKSDEKYEVLSSYANAGFPILLKKLGIENETKIDEDKARKLMIQYYRLLVSNAFYNCDDSEQIDPTSALLI